MSVQRNMVAGGYHSGSSVGAVTVNQKERERRRSAGNLHRPGLEAWHEHRARLPAAAWLHSTAHSTNAVLTSQHSNSYPRSLLTEFKGHSPPSVNLFFFFPPEK